jgi:hypothetical protein
LIVPDGSVGDELTRTEQWLYATLSGDATLAGLCTDGDDGVHADVVKPGAAYPAVVFQYQGGADVRGAGPLRIMVNAVWVVKFGVEGRDMLAAQPGADRIDELLQAASGTVDGADIVSCVRDAPFRMAEDDADSKRHFRWLGGIYRIFAQHIV